MYVVNDGAWQVLGGLQAWQITEFPRRPHARQNSAPDQDRADLGATQRLQALVSAFHYGAPVAFGWMREHAGGPVRVLAAGPALAGAADVLTFPAGARAQPLRPGQVPDLLARMPCWMRLAGITDALLAGRSDPGPVSRDARPSLEDGLLSAWSGPFAWLVLAEPVSAGELHDLVAEVSLAQLSTQRSDAPPAQLAAQRLSARHAELRQAPATGLWRVRVVAGGPSPSASAQIAGLLCASTDLEGLPYALAPVPGCAGLAESVRVHAELTQRAPLPRARDEPDIPSPAAPFYASSRLVAALARPPARELPGIRLVLRPDFDVTPETAVIAGDGNGPPVPAGTVLDWNRVPAGELAIPQMSLNRHVFVCGATGAGKSQTIRGLLEAATGAGIPWLVVEPAKAEYRLMAARLPGTQVIRIRPGELGDPPAGINPLEPAPGPDGARFPLQTHADLVRALFLAAFDADEPFPQVLAAALTRCYERAGWDLVTGEPATPGLAPGYPALEDLQATALDVVSEIGYGREITDNVRGFVTVRISSLRQGTTGRFLQGGHPLDFTRLLAANVVFEIEDTGDDRDKAFLMGTVLIRLAEHLRLRQRTEGATAPRLRHLSVFEEAHRLLRQPRGQAGGAAAHAVEMFAGLLAEIRAYGEGLIIAEQIPSKLIPDVIKNTAVKIVHRLPAADDRDSVGATMNLTEEQSAYLVTLVPGEAAVFTDGMDYPLLTRMPDGTSRETAGFGPGRLPRPADHLPQPHLRTRLQAIAVYAAAGPGRPARRDQRPADHRVGRTIRAGPPDRLAHAHARPGPGRRHGRDDVPAPGLRPVPRGRRRRRRPHPGHLGPGQRRRAGRSRHRGDARRPGRRPVAVRPARTPVAGPALPVGAGPGQPAGPAPPRPRRRAAPPHRRVGGRVLPRHPRCHLRQPAPDGPALVRHRPARPPAGPRGQLRHLPGSRHRAGRRRPRRRPGLGTAPRRRPHRVPRLPLAPGLPAARGRNLTYLAEAADSAWNASSTLSR